MEIIRKSLLNGASEARGITVVIDVFRAFTCSAIMFHYGLKKMILVEQPEEAINLKEKIGGLIVGEVRGKKQPGFDFGNSPKELIESGRATFEGKQVIMRTSAGTRGVIAALNSSEQVILGSFVNACSTSNYIKALQKKTMQPVTIVGMGMHGEDVSIEDEYCGDYLSHLLEGTPYDHLSVVWEIIHEPFTEKNLNGGRDHFPREDVIIGLQADIFSNVLIATKEDDLVVVQNKIY
jgi:2-phosphosulfolactate phosphatase